jgi:TctA family transporter
MSNRAKRISAGVGGVLVALLLVVLLKWVAMQAQWEFASREIFNVILIGLAVGIWAVVRDLIQIKVGVVDE